MAQEETLISNAELREDSGFTGLLYRISTLYQLSLNEEAVRILETVYNKDPNKPDGEIFFNARLLAGKNHDVTALSSLDPEIQSAIAALRLLYNRHNNNN